MAVIRKRRNPEKRFVALVAIALALGFLFLAGCGNEAQGRAKNPLDYLLLYENDAYSVPALPWGSSKEELLARKNLAEAEAAETKGEAGYTELLFPVTFDDPLCWGTVSFAFTEDGLTLAKLTITPGVKEKTAGEGAGEKEIAALGQALLPLLEKKLPPPKGWGLEVLKGPEIGHGCTWGGIDGSSCFVSYSPLQTKDRWLLEIDVCAPPDVERAQE